MVLQTSTSSVNISGGVTAMPTPDGTSYIHWTSNEQTGNGAVQTVYTVPAGYTLYVYGMSYKGTNGEAILYENDGSTAILTIGNINTYVQWNGLCSAVPLAKYTATQAVKADVTNAHLYTIWGILELD